MKVGVLNKMGDFGRRPFCVRGGEIIGNVPTIEELAVYIKDYVLNDSYAYQEWLGDNTKGATRRAIVEGICYNLRNESYSSIWGDDATRGATRQAIYNIIQTIVGQLEYKGLWEASGGSYPSNPELGWYYVVSEKGEVGGIQYEIGDWIIWNGTSWDKLAGKTDVMSIGAIIMYDGTGIANVETRTTELGDEGGDAFRMNGWYVCNGLASTPDLTKLFVKGGIVSGVIGGSDDAVVVEHTHPRTKAGFGTGSLQGLVHMPDFSSQDYVDSIGFTEAEGVSGVDKNIPSHYTVIYIIKKG